MSRLLWFGILICAILAACMGSALQRSRTSSLPADVAKVTPQTDLHPPKLHDTAWLEPVPAPAPISTSGGEDACYISPDGRTLWFFFTPDVRVPAEKQLLDGVTGIYEARWERGRWQEPVRVVLKNEGELTLDGAPCVQGDTMWFCSARVGNRRGVDMWIAQRRRNVWTDWRNAGDRINRDLQVGEVHLTADRRDLYYHADRPGGKGKLDIWRTRRTGDGWAEPEAVEPVNSPEDDSRPFVTYDGSELWITRTYLGTPAIYRSKRVGGRWAEPTLIVSQFAGEPTLDRAGNLYFVHHFFREGRMVEADIYVARPRKPRPR